MTEKLRQPTSIPQPGDFMTANLTQSPKYACFELVFGGDRGEAGTKARKSSPPNSPRGEKTISTTLESSKQKQHKAEERRKVGFPWAKSLFVTVKYWNGINHNIFQTRYKTAIPRNIFEEILISVNALLMKASRYLNGISPKSYRSLKMLTFASCS